MKKLRSGAALIAACFAVSMPIGAKENTEPWSNAIQQTQEHVTKETGFDKHFAIGKTIAVKLDSAYVTANTKVRIADTSLYKKIGKLIPAPFYFRSITVTKEMKDYIEFPDTIAYEEKDESLFLRGELQCIKIDRIGNTNNTVTATYTGVLLAE